MALNMRLKLTIDNTYVGLILRYVMLQLRLWITLLTVGFSTIGLFRPLPPNLASSLMRLLVRMLIFSRDSLVKGRTSYCRRGRLLATAAAAFATARKPSVESAEPGGGAPSPPPAPPSGGL